MGPALRAEVRRQRLRPDRLRRPRRPPDKPALEASLPGVFATGDVSAGSVKRGGGIGEGAAVVAAIHSAIAAS